MPPPPPPPPCMNHLGVVVQFFFLILDPKLFLFHVSSFAPPSFSLSLICCHSLHSCFISTRAILPYLSLCYHRQLRRPDWLLRSSFRARWWQHCLFEQLTSCSPPSTSATPRLLKPPPTTLEPSRGSSR